MKFFKKALTVMMIAAFACAPLAACGEEPVEDDTFKDPVVTFHLSNDRTISCELYPSIAPITVEHFLNLVDSHFYDGTIFHRVIGNFMIQGGGFTMSGNNFYDISYKTPASSIKGEFAENGFENNLRHTPGVISMARATDMDSATNQFFICSADCTYLNGSYAAFGKVIDDASLETVMDISAIQTTAIFLDAYGYFEALPMEPVVITSVTRK